MGSQHKVWASMKNYVFRIAIAIACGVLIQNWIASVPAFASTEGPAILLDDPTVLQHRVVAYLMLSPDSNLVIVDAGKNQGVVSGAIMKVYRKARQTGSVGASAVQTVGLHGLPGTDLPGSEPVVVEMGTLKALEVQQNRTIAAIVSGPGELATAFFPKFPQVMAGDVVQIQRAEIRRNIVLTPELSLTYENLFEDPGANPRTFELSVGGKDLLRQAATHFANARMLRLFVEGHTDTNGPADINQIESLQRAKTVRQFLIEDQEFESERLVPIGFGESEPVEMSGVTGAAVANRRIVLKVVPAQ